MSWQNIVGHDQIALAFARADARNRLGGSFIFVGPPGVGKQTFAFALAKTVLCLERKRIAGSLSNQDSAALLAAFVPCSTCESCRLFERVNRVLDQPETAAESAESQTMSLRAHPDFHYVFKEPEKKEIPMSLLVGGSREGLCSELYKKPFYGLHKIGVINDADCFNEAGANALLKTLEEPPDNTLIFLLGTSTSKQLPTIRSRCQIFRFLPIPPREMAELLLKQGRVESIQQGISFAQETQGSMALIDFFNDEAMLSFRTELFQMLAAGYLAAVPFAAKLIAFIETAGKTTALQRNRLRFALIQTAEFYRNLSRCRESGQFDSLGRSVRAFYQKGAAYPLFTKNQSGECLLVCCVERVILALEQIDAMGTPYLVIENLAHDLARLTSGRLMI